ncbi:hypothetical protein RRG08_030031 [Elysia crispata]|uniref:Uncharacterized protein n=1 Tax=Elysia crispata TaxID=231223 RepID=A0AAE0XYC8_9GAST|nr:hypothetical protein RRG08_030031 [Elysia crispata]
MSSLDSGFTVDTGSWGFLTCLTGSRPKTAPNPTLAEHDHPPPHPLSDNSRPKTAPNPTLAEHDHPPPAPPVQATPGLKQLQTRHWPSTTILPLTPFQTTPGLKQLQTRHWPSTTILPLTPLSDHSRPKTAPNPTLAEHDHPPPSPPFQTTPGLKQLQTRHWPSTTILPPHPPFRQLQA